jgi:hypothetical protein
MITNKEYIKIDIGSSKYLSLKGKVKEVSILRQFSLNSGNVA